MSTEEAIQHIRRLKEGILGMNPKTADKTQIEALFAGLEMTFRLRDDLDSKVKMREKYPRYFSTAALFWCLSVLAIVIAHGFRFHGFELHPAVLASLVASATVGAIGIVKIIASGIFKQ